MRPSNLLPIDANGELVAMLVLDPDDTDADSLPDAWEQTHFGDLDETGTGDVDGDGLTQLDEYEDATDPNNPYSGGGPSEDNDSDGMFETWETAQFGTIHSRRHRGLRRRRGYRLRRIHRRLQSALESRYRWRLATDHPATAQRLILE